MIAGGAVLIVAGFWIGAQVLAGNALGRLGISGAPTKAGDTPGTTTQAPGPPINRVVPPGVIG